MRSSRSPLQNSGLVAQRLAEAVQLHNKPMELKLEELSARAFEHGVNTQ